eukprot:2488889-Alexandrium_andersonii.AAC.1
MFAGNGPGSLRADLVGFAESGQMSDRLRTAVAGYQLAMLGDSVAEGHHAYVSRTVKVRTAAAAFHMV